MSPSSYRQGICPIAGCTAIRWIAGRTPAPRCRWHGRAPGGRTENTSLVLISPAPDCSSARIAQAPASARGRTMSNRCSGADGYAWWIVAVDTRTRRPTMTTSTDTPAPAEAAVSVYQAIGGRAALVAAVDGFFGRMLADPGLSGFFPGGVGPRHRAYLVTILGGAPGGPERYRGPDLAPAHR